MLRPSLVPDCRPHTSTTTHSGGGGRAMDGEVATTDCSLPVTSMITTATQTDDCSLDDDDDDVDLVDCCSPAAGSSSQQYAFYQRL